MENISEIIKKINPDNYYLVDYIRDGNKYFEFSIYKDCNIIYSHRICIEENDEDYNELTPEEKIRIDNFMKEDLLGFVRGELEEILRPKYYYENHIDDSDDEEYI